MDADDTPACDVERAERYVAGQLGDADQDAFELHLLTCRACAETVQALAATRALLASDMPAAAGGGPWLWLRVLAVAAVLVVIALTVAWLNSRRVAPDAAPAVAVAPPPVAPAVDLVALSQFTPPPYVSLRTRTSGSASSRPFDTAMASYNAGNYARAAELLAGVVKEDPRHATAQLFLGVSLLAAGRAADAIAPLTMAAGADTPNVQLARVMLARAHLRLQDVASARRALERVAQSSDSEAATARELLAKIARRTQ